MSVEELIAELQKIEDKTLPVFRQDNDYYDEHLLPSIDEVIIRPEHEAHHYQYGKRVNIEVPAMVILG